MTVRIHRVGHERAHVLDLPGPARIEERRVQIQIGVRPLDGCAPQRFYSPIEPLRDQPYRRASHALTQQCFSHVAHLALRHTAHVSLHHHLVHFFTPAPVAAHHVGGRAAFPAARHHHVDLTQAREQAPEVRPFLWSFRLPTRSKRRAPTIAFNSSSSTISSVTRILNSAPDG